MSFFGPDVLQQWDGSSHLEWITTNGIGGYASCSLAGANTRRYHGLLVAAFSPPVGRAVLLSKIEEEVRIGDQLYLLSANKYPSIVQPQGFRHLASFEPLPVPTFCYRFHEGGVEIEKTIWMPYGKNTVCIRYHVIRAVEPIRLRLSPLMAYKDYHTEQHRWDGFLGTVAQSEPGRVDFTAYPSARAVAMHTEPPLDFTEHSGWYFNFEHCREQERGLDYTEDLYCPGYFDRVASEGDTITVVATIEQEAPLPSSETLAAELDRRGELLAVARDKREPDSLLDMLVLAADQFVIPRGAQTERATILAGYHWFTDWGRDTMIALPGLCLSTRRFDVAREILVSFSKAIHNGLLPNRFADGGSGADYNTVDATLWYFEAIGQYVAASGDHDLVTRELLPVLDEILRRHTEGTDYGIHVDPADGLLAAGAPGAQLTWMDARVGDWVVTPRHGKPVEINALWYNALSLAAEFHTAVGNATAAADYSARATRVREQFNQKFSDAATGGLIDCINPDGTPDGTVRPNQIFAVSLTHPVVDPSRAKAIVRIVEERLLTPFGLRTLAPGSQDYHPHYGPGDQRTRDGGYHQGTVWPWLIGPFVHAHYACYKDRSKALGYLDALLTRGLRSFGAATISEIADAEPPFAPNGCIAQAWSVAEVLRAYVALT